MRSPGIWAAAAVAIVVISGCKSSEPTQSAPLGETSSTTSSGGAGGSGGGGSPASSTGSSSSTHASSTGSGGSGGGSGGSSDVWSCNQSQGYWAVSTGFTSPTPERLAAALNDLGYDDDAHPISFIVRASGGNVTAALSATETTSSGEAFPAGEAPTFASLIPTQGEGVTTVDAQPHAFLHFVDAAGPVDLAIDHLVFTATETFSCNQVAVDIQAVLPSSTYATVLHLPDGDMTVGDLVEQQMVPAPQVHLSFRGQPMTFDFSSL